MLICPQCDLRHFDTSRDRCLVCGAELIHADDPRIGQVLGGRYRLEQVIGEGGMAIVYLARHTLMDRPYAVKILHDRFSADEKTVERMRREARMTASLTHPNIIQIYDFGLTDDRCPYIIMELLEGRSLREVLRAERIDLPRLIDIGIQMATGLARAHDFGVVHRDLKPENVFVLTDAHGRELVKLVDFGIARAHEDTHLTTRGEIVGTPQYMAPDRAMSADVTPSCDLYSLGVVLYEMATGVLPFEANSATGFLLKHIHETARAPIEREPGLPVDLDRLIRDLMAKDPVDRPVDAHRVVERLSRMSTSAEPFDPDATLRPGQSLAEHTGTLDRWMTRSALFDRLVERAYGDDAPPTARSSLVAIREAVARLRSLREEGVRAQHQLDALEEEGRTRSERIGHAVHVLAIDLSRAREEQRAAHAEREQRAAETAEAKRQFDEMLTEIEALRAQELEHPSERIVQDSRALAEAAERWRRADRAAERSGSRAERSAREVSDLDFQIQTLRAELQKAEGEVSDRGEQARALLTDNQRARAELQRQLAEATDALVGPLRDRPDLSDLFGALEEAGRDTAPPAPPA